LKYILYILAIGININLFSQDTKKIEILNADYTFADIEIHPDYWRLIGNVIFSHNNVKMTCDSAYHYINKDKMKAFGSVKVYDEKINLSGNQLIYFGNNQSLIISNNVILEDGEMTLKTDEITYNVKSNIAIYKKEGKIINSEKNIYSKKGKYNTQNNIFYFQDSVTINSNNYVIYTDTMNYNSKNEISYFYGPSYIYSNNKTIYCENGWYDTKNNKAQFKKNSHITSKKNKLSGDSLYYNEKLGYGRALNNVKLLDTIENITIYGDTGEYYEKIKKIEIKGKPLLELIIENDTLFLHAKKLSSFKEKNDEILLAYNKVKFFKKDLQGKCDSLSYNILDSTLIMYNQPILWLNDFQIKSDTIKCKIFKGKIEKIYFVSNPIIIEKVDSLNYNQIKGKEIIVFLKENKIKKMEIFGNGQSIYIAKDEQEKNIGFNYIESTDLTLYFKEQKLNNITYQIKPNSVTTPYEKMKEEDKYLKGFLWLNNKRPKNKNDIY
tara:strand:- start:2594 stop:4075 length:1482 start_codon:yes stop_codon:yes gene_type:complete